MPLGDRQRAVHRTSARHAFLRLLPRTGSMEPYLLRKFPKTGRLLAGKWNAETLLRLPGFYLLRHIFCIHISRHRTPLGGWPFRVRNNAIMESFPLPIRTPHARPVVARHPDQPRAAPRAVSGPVYRRRVEFDLQRPCGGARPALPGLSRAVYDRHEPLRLAGAVCDHERPQRLGLRAGLHAAGRPGIAAAGAGPAAGQPGKFHAAARSSTSSASACNTSSARRTC